MPKVSQEHLDARRAQILDGARGAFATFGYDAATVSRLEESTGLSRGAIFHYFPDKLAIFVALAAETNRRLGDLLVERGLDEAIRAIANENPEWLGVLIEVESKLRHDKAFEARLIAAHQGESARILDWFVQQQRDGVLRDDISANEVARFATLVMNGLAIRIASGDPIDAEMTIRLLRDALAPRQ